MKELNEKNKEKLECVSSIFMQQLFSVHVQKSTRKII